MDIVIKIHDIPQNDHERWVLKNGTPLPKGHGKLIDESEITSIYYHEEKAEQGVINFRGIVIDGTDAPTIIEADGGKEDVV